MSHDPPGRQLVFELERCKRRGGGGGSVPAQPSTAGTPLLQPLLLSRRQSAHRTRHVSHASAAPPMRCAANEAAGQQQPSHAAVDGTAADGASRAQPNVANRQLHTRHQRRLAALGAGQPHGAPLASITSRVIRLSGIKPGRRAQLVARRPIAGLSLLPQGAVLFTAGAVAGAIGKTLTAPLDRVKILLQTQGGLATAGVRSAAAKGNLVEAFLAIGRQEGFAGYWRGNFPQVLRVLPYSACQLCSYEVYKRLLGGGPDGQTLSVPRRMAAGAAAGMTSTLLTYPLDTLRLRLAVDPSVAGMRGAAAALMREGRGLAFYRGLGVALIGIAPYMALELSAFDMLPPELPAFVRGFSAALIATTCCYPLDTLRRQIQMQSAAAVPARAVIKRVLQTQGIAGFYRGFLPNAAKNLPNKGVRLGTFDAAKKLLTRSQIAFDEEMAKEA